MTDSDRSDSSDRGSSAETVQNAWEALLTAVQNGADDLRLFHDTMRRAQLSPTAPFPRAMVATTERIIRNLGLVDQELRDVLAARPHRARTTLVIPRRVPRPTADVTGGRPAEEAWRQRMQGEGLQPG